MVEDDPTSESEPERPTDEGGLRDPRATWRLVYGRYVMHEMLTTSPLGMPRTGGTRSRSNVEGSVSGGTSGWSS